MEAQDLKHISWTISDGVVVVRLRFAPRIAFDAYDEISHELACAADVEGGGGVLVNFEALDHLTSRLLGIMVALSKTLSAGGRALAVCRMRPEPLRAFRACRLDASIPVYPTEEEARVALSKAGSSS